MSNEYDCEITAGGTIPGSQSPAFSLHLPRSLPLPVLIAAPHGGRAYPEETLADMREPRWSALRLEDRHADGLAQEVAQATGAALLVAHAPRAVLDLNRAVEDVDWAMVTGRAPRGATHSQANRRARSGLGLVPRRLPGLGEIWKSPLPKDTLERRIAEIHRPYHDTLARTMETLRDKWGAALLIDLHSMPPLKHHGEQDKPAEFVIGDRFGSSCSDSIVAVALSHFGEARRRVAYNRPYSGGYVLERHASPRRGLHAIQLEVCRSAYLDARLEEPGARISGVVRLLAGLVRRLASEIAGLGAAGSVRQAAE